MQRLRDLLQTRGLSEQNSLRLLFSSSESVALSFHRAERTGAQRDRREAQRVKRAGANESNALQAHPFFQPFPLPSGASAGAISGVRSRSSVSSTSASIKDFS